MAEDPNAAAGWYPDPHHPGMERRWDGSVWTEEYRPAPAGTPAVAAPAQQKSSGSGFGTGAKVGLGVVLGIGVLIVGCGLLIAGGVEEAEDEAQEHAITRAEFDAIEQGSSQSAVENELGAPDDSQEFESRFGGSVDSSSCIYYNEEGKDLFEGDSYQFCFTNGKLDSKNVY